MLYSPLFFTFIPISPPSSNSSTHVHSESSLHLWSILAYIIYQPFSHDTNTYWIPSRQTLSWKSRWFYQDNTQPLGSGGLIQLCYSPPSPTWECSLSLSCSCFPTFCLSSFLFFLGLANGLSVLGIQLVCPPGGVTPCSSFISHFRGDKESTLGQE